MKTGFGRYEVATARNAVYVRAHGLASMNNCLALRDFLDQIMALGQTLVIMDLGCCTGMDSTFMGVLAGTASFSGKTGSAQVVVVNAKPELIKLLKDVGLTELLHVEEAPFNPPKLDYVQLEPRASEAERIALVKSAHEKLIRLNAENERIFGPLVAALEAEMKKR